MSRLRGAWMLIGLGLLTTSLGGCQKASQLRGRIAGLKQRADEAEQHGARKCAPRELALTRAYAEFAEMELDKGSLSRAGEHVALAELNADAALLQSPSASCTGKRVDKPAPLPGDEDGDGFPDGADKCVERPENFNGFQDLDGCPDDPDTDGDGIEDSLDPCVVEPEDFDRYLDEDGCPELDNDLDGLVDGRDACPLAGEDPDGYEDTDGCPDLDNDGDDVPDLTDECPNTPGQKEKAPLGCPTKPALVVVTNCEVKITQQIHFAYNKAVIQKDSYPVLDAVVEVLDKNSSIEIEVEGHTDDKGSDAYNKQLSDHRAQAVRKYLISHGVTAERLTARGYGEERPLVSNNSDADRSLNRRVQFIRTEGSKEDCSSSGQATPDPANSPN